MTEKRSAPSPSLENDRIGRSLEARFSAHRNVLRWLLVEIVSHEDRYDHLLQALNETYPPQDQQEDPGAVPVEAFAETAAYAAEIRAVLEPVKDIFGGSSSPQQSPR